MKPEDVRAEVEKIVKEAGGATKQEIEALIADRSKAATVAAFDERYKTLESDFNSKTIPFVTSFSASAAIVAANYVRETGEKWTREKQEEMYNLMNSKKNFDPFAIEEEMLKPHREKKRVDEEIERRVQEKLQARRAEQGGYDDDIPQGKPLGALQRMLQESGSKESGVADSGGLVAQAARDAAAALRAEGKG